MLSHPIIVLFFLLLAAITSGTPVFAEQSTFSVTIRTFEGNEVAAVAEHRILFDNGLVYDLPQIDPSTVTMYDPARSQVVLLDRARQVQSTVSTEDLIRITAQARAAADTEVKRDQLGLSAFVEPSDVVVGHSIKFGGAIYHSTTQKPAKPLMATEFGQFSDLASRLNLVRHHWLPPFARMTLSDRITSNGEIPLEMTLTITRGTRSEQYRTTMQIGNLTTEDRAAIEQVRPMMSLYREVPLSDFPAG